MHFKGCEAPWDLFGLLVRLLWLKLMLEANVVVS